MTSGAEIRAARERAGLTQEELGVLVGVTLRTIGNWERGATVSRNRAAKILQVLADQLDDQAPATLRTASDAEVLAEIARRFARGANQRTSDGDAHDAAPIIQAAGSAADEFTHEVLEPGRASDAPRREQPHPRRRPSARG